MRGDLGQDDWLAGGRTDCDAECAEPRL